MFKTIHITTGPVEYEGNTVNDAVLKVEYSAEPYDHMNYMVPNNDGTNTYKVLLTNVPADFTLNFLDYRFFAIQFEVFSYPKYRNGAVYSTGYVPHDYPQVITRINNMGIFEKL